MYIYIYINPRSSWNLGPKSIDWTPASPYRGTLCPAAQRTMSNVPLRQAAWRAVVFVGGIAWFTENGGQKESGWGWLRLAEVGWWWRKCLWMVKMVMATDGQVTFTGPLLSNEKKSLRLADQSNQEAINRKQNRQLKPHLPVAFCYGSLKEASWVNSVKNMLIITNIVDTVDITVNKQPLCACTCDDYQPSPCSVILHDIVISFAKLDHTCSYCLHRLHHRMLKQLRHVTRVSQGMAQRCQKPMGRPMFW
jgi:hypothetical protein